MRWSEQDQVLEYQVLTPDKSANDDEEELEDEDAPDADMQVFAQIEREGGREREREGETQRGEREGGQVQARKAPEEVVALRTCTLMLNSCVCVCVCARARARARARRASSAQRVKRKCTLPSCLTCCAPPCTRTNVAIRSKLPRFGFRVYRFRRSRLRYNTWTHCDQGRAPYRV